MAVLGVQLVLSMILLCFLQRLSRYVSFGRWWICGRLSRFLHPTDEALRTAAGLNHSGKGKGKRDKKYNNDDFTVPRSINITLESAKLEVQDLLQLRHFPDYQWLMDFSACAFFVYVLTEIYYSLGSRSEMNLSMIWCLLAIGFCLRVLLVQTSSYFNSKDSAEMIVCILFGSFFLVFAMGILIVDESIIEFGLVSGYKNLTDGAEAFLKKQGLESHGPISLFTFKMILALLSAIIGALLTFPGLRYGRLHASLLKEYQDSAVMQVILHLNFILPFFILLLWIKPIGRDIICEKSKYRLSAAEFDTLRLVLICVLFPLRLILMNMHLQVYLNLAKERMENMKKESGRIKPIEIQKDIARIFYYLCVVALQYITPVLLIFFLTLMQKSLGEYRWSSLFGESFQEYVDSFSANETVVSNNASFFDSSDAMLKVMPGNVYQFTWTLRNLRMIFSAEWYRGLLSYLNWWVCACWFTSTAFGACYLTSLN